MVCQIRQLIGAIAVPIVCICFSSASQAGQGAKESGQYFLRVDAGGHTSEVRKVIFASDGQKLITVGRDKAVRIWDLKSGKTERTLRAWIGPDFTGEIYAAALEKQAPEGANIA